MRVWDLWIFEKKMVYIRRSPPGRWKYEEALRRWFNMRVSRNSSTNMSLPFQQQRTTVNHRRDHILTSNHHYSNPISQRYRSASPHYHPHPHHQQQQHPYHQPHQHNNDHQRSNHFHANLYFNNTNFNRIGRPQHQRQQQQHRNEPTDRNNHNSTQPFTVMNEETVSRRQNSNRQINLPSRTLIKFYPHKLKTFEQYFRVNEPPKEIEQEKEKLFVIANLFYQYEHYSEDRKKKK